MSHLASLIPKSKGLTMVMLATTMIMIIMSPAMAFTTPHPWLSPSFASRSIAPMSSTSSPSSSPTTTNHRILLHQHQLQLQQQQHQRRTFLGSGFCLSLATGDGTKGNPDNDAEIRDTNDETDQAQAASTIPTDISKYEGTFKDYKFWRCHTSDEDVKDMLNWSVLGSGDPTGALWDPLIATRKRIIEVVKDSLSTPSSLQSFSCGWQISDETNPMIQWIADDTLVQRTYDSSWYKRAYATLRYINADYVWGYIKYLSMEWCDINTRNEFIRDRLRSFKISHVDTVTHDRDYRCPSFFMGNPKFHHDGIDGRQPHEVVLCRPNLHGIEDYVFVYTTGNGSGRTTELAASATLRGGILSIVTTADKDISPEIKGREREQACIEKLKALLDEAIKENPTALRVIINAMNDCREPKARDERQARLERVRIVFCIDDAHNCPNLITGIVREPLDIGDKMGWYIASGCDGKLGGNCKTERKINVVFSVVGTGQYGRSAGSLPSYYGRFTPSWQKLDKTSSDSSSD